MPILVTDKLEVHDQHQVCRIVLRKDRTLWDDSALSSVAAFDDFTPNEIFALEAALHEYGVRQGMYDMAPVPIVPASDDIALYLVARALDGKATKVRQPDGRWLTYLVKQVDWQVG